MDGEKKLSIITVNYNNRSGLKKTVESVINQSFKEFEYIIIDGASTDGGIDILHKYSAHLTYWSSEPDRGIYAAMNKGIRIATGKYLLFLNSGDTLRDTQTLEKIYNQLHDQYDIYYGDIIYGEIPFQKEIVFPKILTFGFFYQHNLSHQASFIKRSLFYEIFFYNEQYKIVSDWEFFIYAVCKHGVSYKHLEILVTDYDATGISSDTSNHTAMNIERTAVLEKHFPTFINDYKYIPDLEDKRTKQFFYIKSHPMAWKTLKALMKLMLLFLPKNINSTSNSEH